MAEDTPKLMLDIDRGYPPVTSWDLQPGERPLVEAALMAGAEMRDGRGERRPFLIPPAVALAIVRQLFGPALGAARSAYHPEGASGAGPAVPE